MGLPGSFIFTNPHYNPGMKSPLYAGLAAALVLTACNQKSDSPSATATRPATNNTATSTSPLDAPVGYLGAVAKAQQTAVKTIDTAYIDKAIQLFSVENGRNPKDLNELVDEKFLAKIPDVPYGTKLVYDAKAGTVKVVNQ
jgi:hypothetical protein